MVNLTAAEHFIAHYLLYRMHSGTSDGIKMMHAFWAMTWGHKGKRIITPEQYELVRKIYSETVKGKPGHKQTFETRESISSTLKSKYEQNIIVNGMCGHSCEDFMTLEAIENRRKRLSENNARFWEGKHLSEEHKIKLSSALKGKHLSEYTKKKMSDAKKGKMKGCHSYYDKSGQRFRLFETDPRVLSHEVVPLNEFRASQSYK